MNKDKGDTIQTWQDTAPWQAQRPYLTNLFERAANQANVPQSDYTLQTIEQRAKEGLDPTSLVNKAKEQYGKTIEGDYLNANPYLDESVNRALGQTRAAVNANFQGDNFGNSAHQEWLGNKLADTAFPYYMNAYESERGRQLNAALSAPTVADAPLSQLEKAGSLETNQPWDILARYQAAISGPYGGSTEGTQPVYGGSDSANLLGLGMLGYGAWKGGLFS